MTDQRRGNGYIHNKYTYAYTSIDEEFDENSSIEIVQVTIRSLPMELPSYMKKGKTHFFSKK